jgi:hypothetical protein
MRLTRTDDQSPVSKGSGVYYFQTCQEVAIEKMKNYLLKNID